MDSEALASVAGGETVFDGWGGLGWAGSIGDELSESLELDVGRLVLG